MTKQTWGKMSHEEKVAAVRKGRRRGLSDEEIGEEHLATKGQVVGFRHRHLPEFTGKGRVVPDERRLSAPMTSAPSAIVPTAKPEPLRAQSPTKAVRPAVARAPDRRPAEPVSPAFARGLLAEPPKLPKLTSDVTEMCTYIDAVTKKRCPFVYEDEASRRCRVHTPHKK